MKRSGPIKRNLARARAWENASRKPMPQQSAKRTAQQPERDRTRATVLARAGHRCQYEILLPFLPCGFLPDRRRLEVDELRGGSMRSTEFLDPDSCRATCPVHHDYKTAHKNEVLALLALHEAVEG